MTEAFRTAAPAAARALPGAWALFGATVVLGVALRLATGLGAPVAMVSDFAMHLAAAEDLSRGMLSEYLVYKGPAYAPWGALGFLVLGGGGYHQWLLWNTLVLYPMTAFALFLLSREVVGTGRFSALPSLMLALLPSAIHVVRLTASENVALLGVCLAGFGLFRALRQPGYAAALLGGALLGLSMLIKALLAMATPVMFAAFLLRLTDRPPWLALDLGPGCRNLLRGLVFAASATAVVLPWSIYATSVTGKPTLTAAYADVALFAGNQPYGDALYMEGLRQAPTLIPDYDPEASRRHDYGQYAAYALWYLTRHPGSLLRDFGNSFSGQFGYSGVVANWVLRNVESGARAHTTLAVERAVFYAILGLGVLGAFSTGGAVSASAAAGVRLLTLYGMVLVPFIVILGDERHRMAFMPFVMVLAAMYLRAAWASGLPWGLLSPPADGVRRLAVASWNGVAALVRLPRRRPRTLASAAAVLLAVGLWRVVTADPALTAEDLEGGTVSRFDSGPLAVPNPVIGLDGASPDRPFEARFLLDAAAGRHEVSVTYAAAIPIPLDLHVDGTPALAGILADPTGGSFNTFAVRRSVGFVDLRGGRHEILLSQSPDFALPGGDVETIPLPLDRLGGDGSGEVSLRRVAYADKIALLSDVHTLARPLRSGHRYVAILPFASTGNAVVKLWILGHDADGTRLRDQSFRSQLANAEQRLPVVPGTDIDRVRILVELWGSGTVRLGDAVTLADADAAVGPHVGPFIEEIRFRRVAD